MTQQDWPDVEKALSAWVKTVDTGTPGDTVSNAGSVTPADLGDRLPFIRISQLGGSDDTITDNPVVDIEVFAASRDQARRIAGAIRQGLRPRVRAGGAIIDSVRTNTSPRMLPWSNTQIARCSATYALGLRR